MVGGYVYIPDAIGDICSRAISENHSLTETIPNIYNIIFEILLTGKRAVSKALVLNTLATCVFTIKENDEVTVNI